VARDKPGNPASFRLRARATGTAAAILAAIDRTGARFVAIFTDRRKRAASKIRGMKNRAAIATMVLLGTLPSAGTVRASDARQDLAQLQRVVESYVRKESTGLPGKVTFSVVPLDPRLSLPHCPSPEAFMPPGGRLWGKAAVGVRCVAPVSWSVYASVQVEVNAEYVVTGRPLAQGETVNAQDLATMRGDLARLPAGIVVDPMHAIGKQVAVSLGAGQPLRQDMLRSPTVVSQGQGVRIVSQGPGFQVSSEGRALGNAAEGQVVQVRAPSGQTVSGIARAGGIVEVRY
jgi:flagella basal body P-ring formation protein FlgA